jgi:hypothetical protein
MVWIKIVLIVGGAILALGGHMWEETAELLHFFGKDVDENRGFKVMIAGLVLLLAGLVSLIS